MKKLVSKATKVASLDLEDTNAIFTNTMSAANASSNYLLNCMSNSNWNLTHTTQNFNGYSKNNSNSVANARETALSSKVINTVSNSNWMHTTQEGETTLKHVRGVAGFLFAIIIIAFLGIINPTEIKAQPHNPYEGLTTFDLVLNDIDNNYIYAELKVNSSIYRSNIFKIYVNDVFFSQIPHPYIYPGNLLIAIRPIPYTSGEDVTIKITSSWIEYNYEFVEYERTFNAYMLTNTHISNPNNPYEWVGQAHNNILRYVTENYPQPLYSGIWEDTNFHNEVFNYVNSSLNVLYPHIDVSSDDLYWYNQLNDIESLLINYSNAISESNIINSIDKHYSLAVLQLSIELREGSTINDLYTGLSKIKALEDTLIKQQFNVQNEDGVSLSLYSISFLKNSYELWMDKYPENGNTQSESNAVNRTRVAVDGMVDFVVGAGTFLSATGATGGLGAGAAAWVGVKAGAKASMAADWIGSLAGWW